MRIDAEAVKIELYIHEVLLTNNRTVRRNGSGWSVSDAGQRSVAGGRWVDRVAAGPVVEDIFPTLEDAVLAALVTQ